MKKKRYSPEQAVRLLREQETSGKTIIEFCREKGFTEQTFHRWKKQFGKMTPQDATELKELRVENARLKQLLAEKELALELIRGKFPKNPRASRNGEKR
jgi:putative transposase